MLSIRNKTGSERPSFAFWGTLEVYNAEGMLVSATPIKDCNGPIKKTERNQPPAITTLPFNQITIKCDETYKITNLHLAWTAANDKISCSVLLANPQNINPKCGVLPEIQILAGVDATFEVTSATCSGGTSSIYATPFGGLPPYSFSWTASDGGTIPAGQNDDQNLIGLTPGTYTLVVKDANECTATRSREITNPSALALGPCDKTNVTCFGGSDGSVTGGEVTNAVGPVTRTWTNSSNVVVGNSSTVSNLPAGAYTLTVTDDCSSKTCTLTIGGPSAGLVLGSCSKTDVTCFGGSNGSVIGGTVTNAVGNLTRTWTNSANEVVGNSSTVSNLPAGTYTLTVTDGCASKTCSVTIGGPSAGLVLGSCSKTDVTCFGGSDGSVIGGTVTNAVGNISRTWTNSANDVVGNSSTVSNLPAGSYTLTVTDGCATKTCSVTIGGPSAGLVLGSCSKTDVTCFGGSNGSVIGGTVTNTVGNISRTWTNSANEVVGNSSTVSDLPAGTYTLTVSDGCATKTCTVTIGGPSTGLTLGSCSKTDVTCFGGFNGSVIGGTVTNAVGNISRTWTNSANEVVGNSSTVSNLPAGTYTLTVTDGCATKTCTVTIGGPSAGLTLGNCSKTDATCTTGGSVTAGDVTYNIGTIKYSWKNSSDEEVGILAEVSDLPAGLYTLTVSDDCSSKTCNVTINGPAALDKPTVCIVQPDLCGLAGSVTITSTAPGTGIFFSIDNGEHWQTSNVFNDLNGGSVTGILVKIGDCTSPAADCSVSSCAASFKSASTSKTGKVPEEQLTKASGTLITEETASIRGVETINIKLDPKTIASAGPNPFSDRIRFAIQSGTSGKGSLELYNMLGQKVKTVFEGHVEAGRPRSIEYLVPASQRTNLMWVFTVGDQKVSGKLIGIK